MTLALRRQTFLKHVKNHAGGEELLKKADLTQEEVDGWIAECKRKKAGETLDRFCINTQLPVVYLACWAARCGISFNAFNDPMWKELGNSLKCGVFPSGDTLRRRVFPHLLEFVKGQLRSALKDVRSGALTADGWSRLDLSLSSLTLSWTSPHDFQVHTIPVGATLHPDATAAMLAASWRDSKMLDALVGPDFLINMLTTDGGANYKAAARSFVGEAGWWRCMCHRLANFCEAVLPTLDPQHLLARIEGFVQWVHSSPQRRRAFRSLLREDAGVKVRTLVCPGATRWFSKLDMAARYVEVADSVRKFVSRGSAAQFSDDPAAFVVSTDDVRAVSRIIQLLQPLHDVSMRAESGSSPTMCHVASWLAGIRAGLEPSKDSDPVLVLEMKRTLGSKFDSEFRDVFETVNPALCAAVVNPECGHLPWITAELRQEVWEQVAVDAVALLKPKSATDDDGSEAGDMFFSGQKSDEAAIRQDLAVLRKNFESEKTRQAACERFPAKDWSGHVDVQAYWREARGHALPNTIVELVCMYLAGQASGAASERLWSSATFTATRRPQLSAANLETAIHLHAWLQLPNFPPAALATFLQQQTEAVQPDASDDDGNDDK